MQSNKSTTVWLVGCLEVRTVTIRSGLLLASTLLVYSNDSVLREITGSGQYQMGYVFDQKSGDLRMIVIVYLLCYNSDTGVAYFIKTHTSRITFIHNTKVSKRISCFEKLCFVQKLTSLSYNISQNCDLHDMYCLISFTDTM